MKKTSLFLALVILAASLAACSDEAPTENPSASTGTSAVTDATESSSEILTDISTAWDDSNGYENTADDSVYIAPDPDGKKYTYISRENYAIILTDYINTPFMVGNESPELMKAAVRYCIERRHAFPYVERNFDEKNVTVSGEKLKRMIFLLFGAEAELDTYELFQGASYDSAADKYTFSYADEVWTDDPYTEDLPRVWSAGYDQGEKQNIPVRPTGKGFDEEVWLEYHFETVTDEGIEYERLLSVTVSESAEFRSHVAGIVNYIHDPYTVGDELSLRTVYNFVTYRCIFLKNVLPFITDDPDRSFDTYIISGENLERMAKNMFGAAPELVWNEMIIGNYDPSTDMVKYCYATDHWGGDPYYIDWNMDNEFTETEDSAVATVYVCHRQPGMVNDDYKRLEYSFEKLVDEGVVYYRLTGVREAGV